MALSSSVPALLSPGAAHAAISFTKSSLSVSYWANVTPKQAFMSVLNGFAKQYGLAVTFNPEPPDYPAFVQKFTTYLSSGYTGLDAMWIDDFSVASWGTAGWLEPLEHRIPRETVAAHLPVAIKSSTYNGHLYRLSTHLDFVIFFYRKDLFDKEGLSAPRTWNDIVRAGKRLTKGGRYGIGVAGKSGTSELFNEIAYYVGQAGADPLHLTTQGARTALKFMYDLIHTYKVAPPDTPAADYSSLLASFMDGRFAMWPVWDGFYGSFQANTRFWTHSKLAVSLPPRGPVNNSSLFGSWGWAISKFSKNKDMAAKFIQYAASAQSEDTLALTGSTPGRVSELTNPKVTRVLHQDPYLALYIKEHIPHPRPLSAQTQRLSDAIEAAINPYLNNQISLDKAVNEAQQKIDQIRRLS
jgi:ABC-type glycerol-3-phosphate transport system substrate-binding protein